MESPYIPGLSCPKCDSNRVVDRSYYDHDGSVTDQLYECERCDTTGDKYDFGGVMTAPLNNKNEHGTC